MRVGDLLEWLAGLAFCVAAYLATGRTWVVLLVAGMMLGYQAQCWAQHPVKLRRLKAPTAITKMRRRSRERRKRK